MNPWLRISLDLIFPSSCLLCGVGLSVPPERSLCSRCRSQLSFDPKWVVEPTSTLQLMGTAGVFHGPLRELIHKFKYNGKDYLGGMLSQHLVRMAGEVRSQFDFVIPVPLSGWKMFERGYNQAELLARILADRCGVPLVAGSLRRRFFSATQTNRGRRQRQKNAERSYYLKSLPASCRGRRALLVDDVATTGSTLIRCAKVLREAGVSSVIAVALAREEYRPN